MSLEWSIKQQTCAKLLAVGLSQTAAADRADLELRTVQRWMANQDYRRYIQSLHDAAWERVEPEMQNLLLQAIDVERQVLNGEMPANDSRYKAAQRRIDQFLDHMGNAPTAPSTPAVYVDQRQQTAYLPAVPQQLTD